MATIYGKAPVSVSVNGEEIAKYIDGLSVSNTDAGSRWMGRFTIPTPQPIKIRLELGVENGEHLAYTMDGYPAGEFVLPGNYKQLTFAVTVAGELVEQAFYVTNIQKVTNEID